MRRTDEPAIADEPPRLPPTLAEATSVYARIGLLSFGGPAAQIALIHRQVVDERRWITERQFLDALGFCMLLPGPEAMQLATYTGWLTNGWRGGLIAGILFVAPGALVVLAFAAVYAAFGNVPLVEALFVGIKAAVLAIVVQALARVARRALTGPLAGAIALAAFLALFVAELPFPLVVALAALVGILRPPAMPPHDDAPAPRPAGRTLPTLLLWLGLWWLPVGAVALLGAERLTEIGVFFSKLAVVTFGGAYAVLAYMAQEVAGPGGWLEPGEIIDGLGLAETTPGPLILVTEFVAFLAAERVGGPLYGLVGAALALWVTFVPCFLWIFVAAPHVSALAARPRLKGALDAITAAVVGVIANLSLWFALHTLFGTVTRREAGPVGLWWPDLATLSLPALALAILAAALLFGLRWGVMRTLAAVSLAGLALSFL